MNESITYRHYILKDHLGSWTTITDAEGGVEQEVSYDAWGNARSAADWTSTFAGKPLFDRGFTLHEHLYFYDSYYNNNPSTNLCLINMKFALSESRAKSHLGYAERCKLGEANGRLYDPAVGRMLSPDIVIQQEHNSQAYNRYSYCFNNPLRFTDPSGYVVDIPPEYFLIEEYIKYNDTESLKELGITNYSSNTEPSEGKMVTTTTWMCDDREYKLITHTQDFPFYEQHFSRSCLAISTVAQEMSNGLALDNNMVLLSEIVNMTCFKQPNAFENGLIVDDFLERYTGEDKYTKTNFSCSFSSYIPHSASILNTNLGYLLSEFDKGNGVGFVVNNDNWIENHFVNMFSYSKLYEDGSYQDYNIKVWDSDFFKRGARGGVNNLHDYQNLLKVSMLIK